MSLNDISDHDLNAFSPINDCLGNSLFMDKMSRARTLIT